MSYFNLFYPFAYWNFDVLLSEYWPKRQSLGKETRKFGCYQQIERSYLPPPVTLTKPALIILNEPGARGPALIALIAKCLRFASSSGSSMHAAKCSLHFH